MPNLHKIWEEMDLLEKLLHVGRGRGIALACASAAARLARDLHIASVAQGGDDLSRR